MSLSRFVEQLERWTRSCVEYAADVLKINTTDATLEYFVYNNIQLAMDEIVNDIRANGRFVRLIVLKLRRAGISTWYASRVFWLTNMNPNSYALMIAHDPDAASTIFAMQKRFYANLPPKIKPQVLYDNRAILEFNTKSRVGGLDSAIRVAAAGKENLGSSQLVNFAHFSEFAKWQPTILKAIMTSLMPCIPKTAESEIIIESTAFGLNTFHTMYVNARYKYKMYLNSVGELAWECKIDEKAPAGNTWSAVFIPCYVFEKNQLAVSAWEAQTGMKFERTAEETLICELYLKGCTDNRANKFLCWRRMSIADDFNGDLSRFNQENPLCVSGRAIIGTERGLVKLSSAAKDRVTAGGAILGHYNKGVAGVVKVTTHAGYSLTCTGDHKVGISDGSWKAAADLCPGDTVALSPPMLAANRSTLEYSEFPFIKSSVEVTEDMGRFLGYFMGDGSYYNGCFSVVCAASDTDVIEDVQRLFTEVLGVKPYARMIGKNQGGVEIRASSKRLGCALYEMGLFYKNANSSLKRLVHVPDVILRSPAPVVREFLRALFECDGFNGYSSPRVMFFSKYKSFASDVQMLLLAFGITSRLTEVTKYSGANKGLKKHEYVGYELSLRRDESVAFNERIGFISGRKMAAVSNWKVRKKTGRNAQPMLLQDSVVSVVDAGMEEVFDITVEGSRSFSANGFLVHNCDIEAFISSGETAFDTHRISARLAAAPPPLARYEIDPVTGQFMLSATGRLWVWEEPKAGEAYAIPADIAKGIVVEGNRSQDDFLSDSKHDFSVCSVKHQLTRREVAQWHGKIDPDQFGRLLVFLAIRYNNAWLIPESNNHGHTTIATIVGKLPGQMRYKKVYAEVMERPPHKPRREWGFNTRGGPDGGIRLDAVNALIAAERDGKDGIKSSRTFEEMLSFKKNAKGKYEAETNHHDDCITVEFIGAYAIPLLPLPANAPRKAPLAVPGGQGAAPAGRPGVTQIHPGFT